LEGQTAASKSQQRNAAKGGGGKKGPGTPGNANPPWPRKKGRDGTPQRGRAKNASKSRKNHHIKGNSQKILRNSKGKRGGAYEQKKKGPWRKERKKSRGTKGEEIHSARRCEKKNSSKKKKPERTKLAPANVSVA